MQPTKQLSKLTRHIFKANGFVHNLNTVLFFVRTPFIKTYPTIKLVSSFYNKHSQSKKY